MKGAQKGGKKSSETTKERQNEKNPKRSGNAGGRTQSQHQSTKLAIERKRDEDDAYNDVSISRSQESIGYTQSDENEDKRTLEAPSKHQDNSYL